MHLISFFRSYTDYIRPTNDHPIKEVAQPPIFEELTDKELDDILTRINNDIGISRLKIPIRLLVSTEVKYSNLNDYSRSQIFLHIAVLDGTKCTHIQRCFHPQELHAKLVEKLTALV